MPNNFITMIKSITIIRLYEEYMGIKIIAVMALSCNVMALSCNTFKKYIYKWNSLKMSFDDFQVKSDRELHVLFYIIDVSGQPNPRCVMLEASSTKH